MRLEGVAGTSKSVRVLVVDDFPRWHTFVSKMFEKTEGLEIAGNASDGLQAIQEAEQLQPDLVLLDIGLPKLNGIEAARRIREVSPGSKVLIVTENRSVDLARKALEVGAAGYVVKSDGARDLLNGVKAVLEGKRFISSSLASHFVLVVAGHSLLMLI